MRYIFVLIGYLCIYNSLSAQVKGIVIDSIRSTPIPEANIYNKASGINLYTNAHGEFTITDFEVGETLWISHVGYVKKSVVYQSSDSMLHVLLSPVENVLDEINISTGYYQIPKERATGVFVHVDNAELNRAQGGNILERLEGLASGVQYVGGGGTNTSDIRIRGLATIESDARPLVVLDNFPYDGDISSIDPNSIESVTFLQDAAASSIWGARAGNGVIVITSKTGGSDNRTRVSLNLTQGISNRPDLGYGKDWLPSDVVMEIEKERYNLGSYRFANNVANPYYVELMNELKLGKISQEYFQSEEQRLLAVNTRIEAMKYLYRNGRFFQPAITISGGTDAYGYVVSGGLLKEEQNVIGNSNERVNLSVRNRFKPLKNMELNLGLSYVKQQSGDDGVSYNDLGISTFGVSPYLQLKNENNENLAIPSSGLAYSYVANAEENGLLDWHYRPLEEVNLVKNKAFSNEWRINADGSYNLANFLKINANYQYTGRSSGSRTEYDKESFYVRHLVNRYTQTNGSRLIPHNGILNNGSPVESSSHFFRVQLNADKSLRDVYQFSVLAGAEVRLQNSESFPSSILYNYDDEYLTGNTSFNYDQSYPVRPSGSSRIPGPLSVHKFLTNNDLSYYANGSLIFKGKYLFTSSLRYDASNLFGVKTNQKGVPLWSVGLGWELSKEDFYPFKEIVPYLRLRSTYGISGNVNKMISHYPVVRYGTAVSGLRAGTYTSYGNPSLRWESVSTSNIGVDWRAKNNRLTGNIEFYRKKGADLIGDELMDPTTGVLGNYKINYANIATKGLDIQVDFDVLRGPLRWKTVWLLNFVHNKITNYRSSDTQEISYFFHNTAPPTIGKSLDVVYAIPWNGLSPKDGLPIIEMDGVPSTAYFQYFTQFLTPDMLKDVGNSVPTRYGSIRNTFSFRGIEIGAMVLWKGGYIFRRTSMEPDGDYYVKYHQDYYKRWQQPGDEQKTAVPRKIVSGEMSVTDAAGATGMYRYGEALITRGDHIRLHDISLAYNLPSRILSQIGMDQIRLFGYIKNIGMIWKSNKNGIDPDYQNNLYINPKSVRFGIQANF